VSQSWGLGPSCPADSRMHYFADITISASFFAPNVDFDDVKWNQQARCRQGRAPELPTVLQ